MTPARDPKQVFWIHFAIDSLVYVNILSLWHWWHAAFGAYVASVPYGAYVASDYEHVFLERWQYQLIRNTWSGTGVPATSTIPAHQEHLIRNMCSWNVDTATQSGTSDMEHLFLERWHYHPIRNIWSGTFVAGTLTLSAMPASRRPRIIQRAPTKST